MLRFLRSLSFALAAAGLLAPAAAHAATKKSVYPTVSSISPRKITIGQKLTIKGKNYRAGKSSVAFYRKGLPVVFVKAQSATKTKVVVLLSGKVEDLLAERNDEKVATQVRVAVVGARMGKGWTKNSLSPIISPLPKKASETAAPGTAGAVAKGSTCQQDAAAAPNADWDSDGLTNAIELKYLVDPCKADTDNDGMTDGWEYNSALQLNGASVPYPGTRPWPNPLDPTDTGNDFDGDGLTTLDEYRLWAATGTGFPLIAYSDGTQNSGGKQPVGPYHPLDLDDDRNLTDDERDADGDGLSNMVEWHLGGQHLWWTDAQYTKEKPYKIRAWGDLNALKADTDGDGILDGADDEDADGYNNFMEAQLGRVRSGFRVNAYNPCLPDPEAPTCSRYLASPASDQWPPFDGSQSLGDAMPFPTYGEAQPGGSFSFTYNVPYTDWVADGKPQGYSDYPILVGAWDPTPWFRGPWTGTMGPQG